MKKRYERAMTVEDMRAIKDEDIDFSDIPEADEAFWRSARVYAPDRPKTPLNVRLDADVVEWFRGDRKSVG